MNPHILSQFFYLSTLRYRRSPFSSHVLDDTCKTTRKSTSCFPAFNLQSAEITLISSINNYVSKSPSTVCQKGFYMKYKILIMMRLKVFFLLLFQHLKSFILAVLKWTIVKWLCNFPPSCNILHQIKCSKTKQHYTAPRKH